MWDGKRVAAKSAAMRCGWGSKAKWFIPFVDKRVCMAGKTVRFVVNTCHSERFRGEFSRKGVIQVRSSTSTSSTDVQIWQLGRPSPECGCWRKTGLIMAACGHVTTYRHALLYCLSVTNDRKNLSNASVHVWVGVKWTRKQSDSCWSAHTHTHTSTSLCTITITITITNAIINTAAINDACIVKTVQVLLKLEDGRSSTRHQQAQPSDRDGFRNHVFIAHGVFSDHLETADVSLLVNDTSAVSRWSENTPWAIKTCHFISHYNSLFSWCIFKLFVPMETRKNALQ